MAEKRNQNTRILGSTIKGTRGSGNPMYVRFMSPEQKAKAFQETVAGYEAWRRAREARKAKRYTALRLRNLGE